MQKITKPRIRPLASGINLEAKQMQANAGELLPKHIASLESILFIQEGECTLNINGEDNLLKQGDAFIVPAEIIHQIRAETQFKGIHFMPKGIEFQFFD